MEYKWPEIVDVLFSVSAAEYNRVAFKGMFLDQL